MEQRCSVRYRTRMPVFFKWAAQRGVMQEGRGVTCDISTRGLFIHSSTSIALGTRVDIEIEFPPLQKSHRGPRLLGVGQVVRVELESREPGFAVRTDSDLRQDMAPESAKATAMHKMGYGTKG